MPVSHEQASIESRPGAKKVLTKTIFSNTRPYSKTFGEKIFDFNSHTRLWHLLKHTVFRQILMQFYALTLPTWKRYCSSQCQRICMKVFGNVETTSGNVTV